MSPSDHEKYSIPHADVLFEDTWGEADTARCYRCGTQIARGARRCASCGALLAECSRSCASCGLPVCVGGDRPA